MSAGKSLELLRVAYTYEQQGKRVICLSPSLDTRDTSGFITSRFSDVKREAIPINPTTDIYNLFIEANGFLLTHGADGCECVLVDESQFLHREQVLQLAKIVDDFDIPVLAYGLKNDSRNELFEGSYYLLAQADKIEEIKTTCAYCNRKATMVIRLDKNGNPDYDGPQIKIGFDYKPVCRKHYKEPCNI
jgi:thymidine kinase